MIVLQMIILFRAKNSVTLDARDSSIKEVDHWNLQYPEEIKAINRKLIV